jgi:hypothetical protein
MPTCWGSSSKASKQRRNRHPAFTLWKAGSRCLHSTAVVVENAREPAVNHAASRIKRWTYMGKIRTSKFLGFGGVAMIAAAIGAVAVGAFAIGALAIGRLAIRRIQVESAKFKSLEIEDLTVTRLHAAEVIVRDSLKLPGSNVDHKLSS